MENLPELRDLIPSIGGCVYTYQGATYFAPDSLEQAVQVVENGHDLVRIGFKVYNVIDFSREQGAYIVEQYACSVSVQDRKWLREQLDG